MTDDPMREITESLNAAFETWWEQLGLRSPDRASLARQKDLAKEAFMAGAETVFKQRLRKALWPDGDAP